MSRLRRRGAAVHLLAEQGLVVERSDVLIAIMHAYTDVHPYDPIDLPLLDEIADVVMELFKKNPPLDDGGKDASE